VDVFEVVPLPICPFRLLPQANTGPVVAAAAGMSVATNDRIGAARISSATANFEARNRRDAARPIGSACNEVGALGIADAPSCVPALPLGRADTVVTGLAQKLRKSSRPLLCL
jgi:hypothetical protein